MKKNLTIAGVCLLTYSALSHPGSVSVAPSFAPFISIEGSHTWNDINSYTINNIASNNNLKPWGGRLAVGMIRPYSERLSFSGELGGGYYGSQSTKVPSKGHDANTTIDGYDFLVGALYKFNQFNVFGNVGVMVQNNRLSVTQDNALSFNGGLISGTTTNITNATQALPELKVGGIYNLKDNLDITLAYMHVFGSSKEGNVGITATADSIIQQGRVNLQNPTLDSVMLGLRLNIV